ncbi:MAG: AzlD domain-containing protein [Acidimicrobiales bacterium]|nr:AzlD domain-containing protein [Acidimicrobiales bacterium]
MSALLVFLVAALGVYALRTSMIVSGIGERLDAVWTARLGLVSPVMVTSLVASSLFLDGGARCGPVGAEVVAVLAAAWAVRRTGTLAASFAVGFPTYWALSALT